MMKHLKNQQGYALLVVLLMVVLFLSISATFMAGSLSNAKQEQIVDTSNQSVASAEMGVRFFSTDFQKELDIIKVVISEKTQTLVKNLVDCFQAGTTSCDEQHEITAEEERIDEEMKKEYIRLILEKVDALDEETTEWSPFAGDPITYSIDTATGTKINETGATVINLEEIKSMKVELVMSGTSNEVTKKLTAIFTIEVPETFLEPNENLTIETITVTEKDNLVYRDIFSEEWPEKSCDVLFEELKAGDFTVSKECLLGSGDSLADFTNKLIAANMNPQDFKVFTKDFAGNVCTNNCNNIDFHNITLVAKSGDEGIFQNKNNLNNLKNTNLIIDGYFNPQNLNNLGSVTEKQTIILRQLKISNNLNGSGLVNTNLIVLGKETVEGTVAGQDSELKFGNNFSIGEYGRLCFDMDRIKQGDLDTLANDVKIDKGSSGLIIYYTSDPDKKFVLPKAQGENSTDRTKQYVERYDNYTTFLSACGVTLTDTIKELTEVPLAKVLDPDFELDVDYTNPTDE